VANTNLLVINETLTQFIYGHPGAQLDCPLADQDAPNQKFIHFGGKWRSHQWNSSNTGDWTSAGYDLAAFSSNIRTE